MSQTERKYTKDEVKVLVDYTQSIVFDAVQGRLGSRRDEDVSLRMVRKYARVLMCPDLVVDECPPWEGGQGNSMTRENREYWYWFLGDRSRKLTSMTDVELVKEIDKFVRAYR